jgi:hypothetical protein
MYVMRGKVYTLYIYMGGTTQSNTFNDCFKLQKTYTSGYLQKQNSEI